MEYKTRVISKQGQGAPMETTLCEGRGGGGGGVASSYNHNSDRQNVKLHCKSSRPWLRMAETGCNHSIEPAPEYLHSSGTCIIKDTKLDWKVHKLPDPQTFC